MAHAISELFDAGVWRGVDGFGELTDVTYHQDVTGRVARIAFDRPEVRNAFRPHTVDELYRALDDARQNPRIGVVLLTGNGPSAKDGGWAFCSGGDQRIRGRDGYRYEDSTGFDTGFDTAAGRPAQPAVGRLHILEVQRLIRFMPKVVIAVIPGWAAGGGHSLHVVCDLSIASAEHARFKQTDADVGSFDAGYGSAYFARQVGQKFAREVFFLAREYDAARALAAGAINASVPHEDLEKVAYEWANKILGKSPTAIRMLKFAFNAVDDGLVGQQVFAGEATRLAYGTDEAVEGRDAFLEKRAPDWAPYLAVLVTRPLVVVDPVDAHAVERALRAALSGDGPAILTHAGAPGGLPSEVARRVAVVVETSGSTGRPKRVALSADALLASAAASEAALDGPGQWLLALPPTYIAGLNVLVRSFAANTTPVVMNGLGDGFETGHFVTAAGVMREAVRYTALVPVQLARLIGDDAALDVLRRFDRILIGGQAMPVGLAARALELGLNVTRTYGSSETSGGCVYDGVPIGGTLVDIVDGRVELAGPTLAEGYLDDEVRTAAAFIERGGRRWYRTDDTGGFADGVLRITGRADDVIVSGGIKVSLAEVELAVRGLPGLHAAVVVAAPSTEWGEVPVVVSEVEAVLDEVRSAVGDLLGRAAAPARILLVETIPLLPSGKPDRVALTARAFR